MIIYTAIFGPYEEIKTPLIITPGWEYICFTDQDITSDVWKIVKVPPASDPKRQTNEFKIMYYKYVHDSYSVWVDASFYINCDLSKWWQKNFRGSITFMKHPDRDCFYEEAEKCIELKKDDEDIIRRQMNCYRSFNLPEHGGMVAAGIIMREDNLKTRAFCQHWAHYLSLGSKRDQLAWALANHITKIPTFTDWNYQQTDEFLIVPHYHRVEKRKAKLLNYKKRGLLK